MSSTFHLVFKTYKDKKGLSNQVKILERNESFVFEQKSIKIEMFNDEEEKEIKERIEKRKKKRQEVAEKNKVLKQQKQAEKEKEVEQEL